MVINKKKKFVLLLLCVSVICFYVFKEQKYCYQMPFTLSNGGSPIIDVKIDGNIYPIEVDLGAKLSFSLDRGILVAVKKKEHDPVEWRDLKGNHYQANAYLLPKIQIGGMNWDNVVTHEESKDFLANTTFWSAYDGIARREVGTLGRPFFLSHKVLIDVNNSLLVISNDYNKLFKMGYDIKKMVKVSLEEGVGIILKTDTDIGVQKYCIDTGSTVNLARASVFADKEQGQDKGMRTYSSQRCVIGEHDFKETMFYLIDITSELKDIDGCLGMQFLKDHVVYIDYPNRTAYIADSSIR